MRKNKLDNGKQFFPRVVLLTGLIASLLLVAVPMSQAATTTSTTPSFIVSIVPRDCQDEDGCTICELVKIFTNAANIIAGFLSASALLMFIVGGFLLIFSGGQPEKIERGKKVLIGTVTGLAIVFLAWFTVNVIVRLASSSGQNTLKEGATDQTLFEQTTGWWYLEDCEPDLPTSCKGLSVGELCATGECKPGSTACSCYRPIDSTGDDNTCKDDATSVDAASSKDKKCYCASQCTRYAKKTGKAYDCVTSSAAKSGYTIAEGIACVEGTTYVCALKN